MKLSEMKQILVAGDIRLTKSLSQNFLHDGNQLRRIVAAAELKASDKVLEIGPGLGGLTELLLQNAGQVLAIEKDARLLEVLRKRFKRLAPSLSPSDGERTPRTLNAYFPLEPREAPSPGLRPPYPQWGRGKG